jgi:hypothetical protein
LFALSPAPLPGRERGKNHLLKKASFLSREREESLRAGRKSLLREESILSYAERGKENIVSQSGKQGVLSPVPGERQREGSSSQPTP